MRTLLLATTMILATAADARSIGLHQTQRVGPYRVMPVRVVEDSRCPMNARCVWAGRLVVRATIVRGRTRMTRDLTLGEPAAPGLVLDSVSPDRVAGEQPAPRPYRFHFAVVRPD
ncbi:hypothetical protein [Sphingomonas sp.]|uniref:hypothetical protein n=1 Tax=Sphingomonas sp. TaxID=28214 RepID=UPI003B00113D